MAEKTWTEEVEVKGEEILGKVKELMRLMLCGGGTKTLGQQGNLQETQTPHRISPVVDCAPPWSFRLSDGHPSASSGTTGSAVVVSLDWRFADFATLTPSSSTRASPSA